jgi:glucosamine-6-phosphate deaminase
MPSPLTRFEHIPVRIVEDYATLARAVARRMAEIVRERSTRGVRAVLGLATGSTPVGIYRELVRMHREEGSTSRTW